MYVYFSMNQFRPKTLYWRILKTLLQSIIKRRYILKSLSTWHWAVSASEWFAPAVILTTSFLLKLLMQRGCNLKEENQNMFPVMHCGQGHEQLNISKTLMCLWGLYCTWANSLHDLADLPGPSPNSTPQWRGKEGDFWILR